jgi:hypothetical protein
VAAIHLQQEESERYSTENMTQASAQNESQRSSSSSGIQISSQVGMFMVLGMIGASAGFTMYTKRTGQFLRQFEHISQQQLKRAPKRQVGPLTKAEWDKIRPRFDKGDFF